MKHLDVLSDAGLIARAKTGRSVACRLTAAPMAKAMGGSTTTNVSGPHSLIVSPLS
jgi:hypothetical protein